MLAFLIRRTLTLIPILLGVALVSSLMFYIIPGDIVRVMLGQHVDPSTYANVRKALGMDIPFWQNFLVFIKNLPAGDLGYSYVQQRPVNEIILEALPVTFKLALLGMLVTVLVGIPLGVLAAAKERSPAGSFINTGAVIGISVPSFLLALFLQLVFGVKLKLLPVSGTGHGFAGYLLPGLALGLPLAAFYARVARSSMLEVLNQEYMLFAVSRGIPKLRILVRHGLRNALVPVLTQLGMDFGMFMTGAVLTETIFNLPGMGRLVYYSINVRDFPVLRGILLFFALTVVLVNFFVDLIYVRLDPRMAASIVREETDVKG